MKKICTRSLQFNHENLRTSWSWLAGGTLCFAVLLMWMMAGAVTQAAPASLSVQADIKINTKLNAAADARQISWRLQGQADQTYVIQVSANLKNWTDIGTTLTGTNGMAIFTDPLAGGAVARFYRTKAQGPTVAAASYNSDRILVKPRSGADLSALNLTLGVNVLHTFPGIGNLQIIHVPSGTTVPALIDTYQRSGLAVYAEPDYIVHASLMPDDYYFQAGDQWSLWNYGQYGDTAGADIDATNAWDIQNDASNIIVAVVDTGIRYTHQDLAANMWLNPQENQDGYTNDLYGINLIANGRGNGDPWDDYGHGTHCAGIIGAVGNNSVGIAGVAWRVQLMALKFLDTNGYGTIGDVITCMDFASSHGANIVNASWGTTNFTSQALHDAIASLGDKGIMFVAAAGNSGLNNDVTPLYPASYSDLNNLIAVAASDEYDDLTSWSDYGPTNVDLAAPGDNILSCWNDSDTNYESESGTSMAAAMVSGAVAIMEAHFPKENYLQIKEQMMSNVDILPAFQGKCVSGGRLNLYKALTGGTPPPPLTAGFSANPAGGQAPLTVQFTDTSTGNPTSWDWSFGDGSVDSTVQNPSHTYTNAGNFTVTLTVADSAGQTSAKNSTITVTNASTTTVTASFSASPSSGSAPLAIQFTDQSSGPVVSWNWNFGDGTASSTQNPSHTYSAAGNFIATLIVGGSSGQTNSTSHTITVTNTPTPVTAGFSASPSSGSAPLAVQFADQSSGPVVSWSWNFGDGTASSTQNPSHTYSAAGNFIATLIVGGSNGQTNSTSHTITVTNTPTPATVTVVATQPLASILSPGGFTITRSGNANAALTVNYSLGGSAVNGVNYQTLSGSAVIPAGSSTTTVVVQPEGLLSVLQTVGLTISPNSNYNTGSPNAATVTILVQIGL